MKTIPLKMIDCHYCRNLHEMSFYTTIVIRIECLRHLWNNFHTEQIQTKIFSLFQPLVFSKFYFEKNILKCKIN